MGLSGDLRDFHLSEVLQILVMGRKTGVVELGSGNGAASPDRVWLRNGRVVHAERADGSEGVSALVEMLHTTEGRFLFESSAPTEAEGRVTIDRSLEGLLLEASAHGQE